VALSLKDPWRKFERAWAHYEPLDKEIEAFEQSHPYRVRCEVNKKTSQYSFYVNDLAPVGDDWGLRIGDTVHNLRSSLDHLAVLLVAQCTGEDPSTIDYVDFPVFDKPEKFSSWRSKLLGGTGRPRTPVPLLHGYLTRLEELQPYNAWDPSIWGAANTGFVILPSMLERLSNFDNIDKHRSIHPTWHQVEWVPGRFQLPKFPDGFVLIGSSSSTEPLVEDAQVGGWLFRSPLPLEWQPAQVEMKSAFPLQVCLNDPSLVKGVREVLGNCFQAVAGVLNLFEPVFAGTLAPPLPVLSLLPTYAMRWPSPGTRRPHKA